MLNLLIKPASSGCNMKCPYCFYADEANHRTIASYGLMSRETMYTLVDKALAYAKKRCTFMFQGGEPTLAGLEFYEDVVRYVKQKNGTAKLEIEYVIQTNGYMLDDAWAKFFAQNHFLVGVSLDGIKETHDKYRIDCQGKGTFVRIMKSIDLLAKYKVEFNILTVINSATARNAGKIYRFYGKQNFQYQQFIECLNPIGEYEKKEHSLTPDKLEGFLKNLFDLWYLDMSKGIYVYNRYFENISMIAAGQKPESCNMSGICERQWVFEADGSTYPCDFYVLDQWKLGNINTDSFDDMDEQRVESGFIEWSRQINEECRECKWFGLCRGGCRRSREPVTATSSGKNYFCTAYYNFFEYAYPRMIELLNQRH